MWLSGFGDLSSCLLRWLPSCPKAQTIKIAQSYIFGFSAWEPNDISSQAPNVQSSLGKYSISYFSSIRTLFKVFVSHLYLVVNRNLSIFQIDLLICTGCCKCYIEGSCFLMPLHVFKIFLWEPEIRDQTQNCSSSIGYLQYGWFSNPAFKLWVVIFALQNIYLIYKPLWL